MAASRKPGVVGGFSPRRCWAAFTYSVKTCGEKGIRFYMREVCYTEQECRDPCIIKRVQRMAAKFKIPKDRWSSNVEERFEYLYGKVFDPNGSRYYGFKEELFQRKPRRKETQPRKPRFPRQKDCTGGQRPIHISGQEADGENCNQLENKNKKVCRRKLAF